jgi:hypothetical protein
MASANGAVRHFDYSRRVKVWLIVTFFVCAFWPLMMGGLVTLITSKYDQLFNYMRFFATSPFVAWFWLLLIVFYAIQFLRHRPIALFPDGVASFLFGRQWKRLNWNDILIEKEITLPPEAEESVETIIFRSRKSKIAVRSSILDYGIFKEIVNGHLSSRHVAVETIDLSGKARSTRTDKPGRI